MQKRWILRIGALVLLLCLLGNSAALGASSWLCFSCGTENQYAYCHACGTPRETAVSRTCSACGASVAWREGYRYCPACGSRWAAQAAVTAAPQPPSSATPAPGPALRVTASPEPAARPGASPAAALPTRPSAAGYAWYDESTRYYYQQLSPDEKKLFAVLYDGLMAFESQIEVPPGFTVDMYTRVLFVLRNDCPELFQLSAQGGTYNHSGDRLNHINPNYRLTRSQYESRWAQTKKAVEQMRCLSGFSSSDASKQYVIYRYLIEHSDYEKNQDATVYADSVYWYGKSQCCGYTRALNLALRYYGIPCLEVTGKTYTDGVVDDPNGHEWTIAKIDGQWYHCDATWDDPAWENSSHPAAFPAQGNAYLRYLNVPDAFWQGKRTLDEPKYGFTRPICHSYAAHYARQEGIFVEAGQTDVISFVKYQIIEKRDSGLKTIAIFFESLSDYRACMENLNSQIIRRLKNADGYRWWYDENARFLYVIVP